MLSEIKQVLRLQLTKLMRRLLTASLLFNLLSPASSQANEPKLNNLQESRAAG
tara:strand:- start:353 stop:511 length:159 start_codon:yes stop_codon:yes gene_type:complete